LIEMAASNFFLDETLSAATRRRLAGGITGGQDQAERRWANPQTATPHAK
jgi:hypothetical protein